MKQVLFAGAAVVGGLFFWAGAALAAPVTVQNPSFESPLVVGNGGLYDATTPTSWTPANFGGQYVERYDNGGFGTFPVSHQPGIDQNQYVADDFASGTTATVIQDLGVAFQPNTTYTVNLAGGKRTGFTGALMNFGLRSSSAPANNLAGATAGFLNEAVLADGTFIDASAAGANGGVFTLTTGAVAPAGNLLAYISGSSSGTNPRLHFDNFRVDAAPAPEPATVGLLTLASLGVLARRRRGDRAI